MSEPKWKAVLRQLQSDEGWELGRDRSMFSPGVWMQVGGIGNGGKSQQIKRQVFQALVDREFIEAVDRAFPTARYRLTQAGRDA